MYGYMYVLHECIYVYVCVSIYMHTWVKMLLEAQVSDPPELELQIVSSYLAWVLSPGKKSVHF